MLSWAAAKRRLATGSERKSGLACNVPSRKRKSKTSSVTTIAGTGSSGKEPPIQSREQFVFVVADEIVLFADGRCGHHSAVAALPVGNVAAGG